MKSKIFFFLALFLSGLQLQAQTDTLSFEPSEIPGDSVEYELIVLDPGFESYLFTQPSKEFYSQGYYERWNARYVREWNFRHSQPLTFGDMYLTYIDYREDIDYGLELNYRLFHYFRFFEKENGVDLVPEKVF